MRMLQVYASILRASHMRAPLILCVLGVSLWSSATGARQAAPSGPLPAELRSHLQNGRFDVVTSVRGLPLGVRTELQSLFGTPTLDIAEPDAPFRTSGTGDPALPLRRMAAAACSYRDCLMYYERGGSPDRTWRVMLFHWTPAATQFEWGGTAPGGLATIEAVRSAVLSGAITTATSPW